MDLASPTSPVVVPPDDWWQNPLNDFLDILRNEGFSVGPRERIRVDTMMRILARNGELRVPLQQLGDYLSPLICLSAVEQEKFSQLFKGLVEHGYIQKGNAAPKPLPPATPTPEVLLTEPTTEAVQRYESQVKALIRKAGWLWLGMLSVWLIVGGIKYLDTVYNPNLAKVQGYLGEGERPTTPTIPNPGDAIAVVVPTILGRGQWRFYPEPLLWSLLAMVLVAGGMWLLWRNKPQEGYQFYSDDYRRNRMGWKLLENTLFAGAEAKRSLTGLQTHRLTGSGLLDVPATIQATLLAGGLAAEPIWRKRLMRPEYLVIVQHGAVSDHRAELANQLCRRLAQRDIFYRRYDFTHDPRRCLTRWDETRPFGAQVSFDQLVSETRGWTLLLITEIDRLTHPLFSRLLPWVAEYSSWPKRSLLTIEPVECEKQASLFHDLHKAGFAVLPTNTAGLDLLDSWLSDEEKDPPYRPFSWPPTSQSSSDQEKLFPPLLTSRAKLYTSEDSPGQDPCGELLKQLKVFLGEEGYNWLQACAVFPVLHPRITIHLGQVKHHSHPLANEARFIKLAQLPWFQGQGMSRWLREALMADIAPTLEQPIRDQILTLLMTISDPGGQQDVLGGYAQPAKLSELDLKNSDLSGQLLRLIRNQHPGSDVLRDPLFLAFIRRHPLDRINEAWPMSIADLLIPQPGFFFYIGLVLILICGLGLWQMLPDRNFLLSADLYWDHPTLLAHLNALKGERLVMWVLVMVLMGIALFEPLGHMVLAVRVRLPRLSRKVVRLRDMFVELRQFVITALDCLKRFWRHWVKTGKGANGSDNSTNLGDSDEEVGNAVSSQEEGFSSTAQSQRGGGGAANVDEYRKTDNTPLNRYILGRGPFGGATSSDFLPYYKRYSGYNAMSADFSGNSFSTGKGGEVATWRNLEDISSDKERATSLSGDNFSAGNTAMVNINSKNYLKSTTYNRFLGDNEKYIMNDATGTYFVGDSFSASKGGKVSAWPSLEDIIRDKK